MKGVVFHGKNQISVDELPVPEIGKDEVLVNVKACGVCGTDIHIYSGAKGAADCTPPTVLGHEFSGVITKVGENVTEFKVGDRVAVDPNNVCGNCPQCLSGKAHFCQHMIGTGTTSDGGFAEYCAVHKRQLNRISDRLTFEEGAMSEPVSCCLHGLDLTGIIPGDNVLVIGGGTIGQIMIRLAKIAGAANIVVFEPVESKRELAIKSGAVLAIDSTRDGYGDEVSKLFPNKFDKVIECVGLPVTIENAIEWAADGSTVMMFGLTHPDAEVPIKPFYIFQHEITLKASFINPYTIGRAVNLLNSGTLKVDDLITDMIPIENAVQVFEDPSYRTHGKIIIVP